MNANEMTPKANDRMNRIQKISKYLRLILQYGIPLWILFGLLQGLLVDYGIKIPTFSNTSSTPVLAGNDLLTIFPLYWCLLLIVFLFWYRTVVKLFGFFEKGILFTAETVRCIQILGGVYFVRFFLELIFQFLVQNSPLRRMRSCFIIRNSSFRILNLICLSSSISTWFSRSAKCG